MSVLFQRLFLAASLVCVTGTAFADTETKDADEVSVEAKAEDEKLNDAQKKLTADEEWAAKLKKRHHEGDVALGVCGARLSALMWFYQSLVADGRDDLAKSYDAIAESRGVLKTEAERRAIDDGIGTSVTVMNEHSEELWADLLESSKDSEKFQEKHDTLYANVQECLSLFFNRAKSNKVLKEQAEAESAKTETEAAEEDEIAD